MSSLDSIQMRTEPETMAPFQVTLKPRGLAGVGCRRLLAVPVGPQPTRSGFGLIPAPPGGAPLTVCAPRRLPRLSHTPGATTNRG